MIGLLPPGLEYGCCSELADIPSLTSDHHLGFNLRTKYGLEVAEHLLLGCRINPLREAVPRLIGGGESDLK